MSCFDTSSGTRDLIQMSSGALPNWVAVATDLHLQNEPCQRTCLCESAQHIAVGIGCFPKDLNVWRRRRMSRLMEWTRSDRPREVEDNAQDHTEHLKNVLNHYIKTPQRIETSRELGVEIVDGRPGSSVRQGGVCVTWKLCQVHCQSAAFGG
jgi:hypothetical protein